MEEEDAMYYDEDEEEDLMTDADLERALDALHEEAPEEVSDLLKVMNENQIISWEEAERILGDTSSEPIKSSLPQQTRPTEPDNDTDVDNCIRRLLENDPKLVEINLNNMKRTPVPQIRRIIEAMRENTYLEKLSLANMGLYEADISVLCDILEENDTLRVLNVETNYLSGEFFAKLLRAALKFQSLEELKAVNQGVSFSTISEREIIDAVFQNRGITKISINLRLPEGRHKIEQATIRNQEIRRILRRQAAAEAAAAAKASDAAKKAEEPSKTSPSRKKFVSEKNDNAQPGTSEQPKAAASATRPMRRRELKIPKPLAVTPITPKPVLREEPPRILAGNLKELKKKWDSMENEDSPPLKPKVEDIPKRRTSLLAQKWEEVNNNISVVVEEPPLIAPRLKKKVVVIDEADGGLDLEVSAKISLKWNKKSKGGEERQEPSKITTKLKKMATIDEPSTKEESKYLSRWKKTATIDETSTADEDVKSTKEEPRWKKRVNKDEHTIAAATTSKTEAPKTISAWKNRVATIDGDSNTAPTMEKKEEILERKRNDKMDAKREEQPKVTPWKNRVATIDGDSNTAPTMEKKEEIPERKRNDKMDAKREEQPKVTPWKNRVATIDGDSNTAPTMEKKEEIPERKKSDKMDAKREEQPKVTPWKNRVATIDGDSNTAPTMEKKEEIPERKRNDKMDAKREEQPKVTPWKNRVATIDGDSNTAPTMEKKEEISERKRNEKMDAKREEQPKVTPAWRKKIDTVDGLPRADNFYSTSEEKVLRWNKRIAKPDKEDAKKDESSKSEESRGKRATTAAEELLCASEVHYSSVKEDSRNSRWKGKDEEAAKKEDKDTNANVEGAAKKTASSWKKKMAAVDGSSTREPIPSWRKKTASDIDGHSTVSSEIEEIPRWKRRVGADKVAEMTDSTIDEKTKAKVNDRITASKTSPLSSTDAKRESNCEPRVAKAENFKEEGEAPIRTRKVVRKKKRSEAEPETELNCDNAKHSAHPSAAEKTTITVDAEIAESVKLPPPPLTTRPHRLKKSLADVALPPPARKSPPPLMPKKMPPKPAPKPKAAVTVDDESNIGEENGGDGLVNNHNNTRKEDADTSTQSKSTVLPLVPTKPKTRHKLSSRILDD